LSLPTLMTASEGRAASSRPSVIPLAAPWCGTFITWQDRSGWAESKNSCPPFSMSPVSSTRASPTFAMMTIEFSLIFFASSVPSAGG